MTRTTKLGVVVLGVFAVAGCGGGSDGTTDAPGSAGTTAAGGTASAGAGAKAGSGGKGAAAGASGKGGAGGSAAGTAGGASGKGGGGASGGKGGASGASGKGGASGTGAATGGNGAGATGGKGTGATGGKGAGAMGGNGAGATGGNGAGAMGGNGAGAMGGTGAGAMGGTGAGATGGTGAGAMGGTGAGATGGTGSGATGGTGSGGTTACTPVDGGGVFTAVNAWNTDVSCDAPSADSKKIIAALVALGGWGSTNSKGVATNVPFKMDMSIEVMQADGTNAPFQEASGYYLPDCDEPTMVPLPKVGAIEGETGPSGYTCDTANNDCHLLVVDAPKKKLWELYNTTVSGGTVSSLCAIVWDLSKSYPANLRGDGCTSADAGGFPIAAMLPNADEVKAGAVNHAFRFILGNDRIRKHQFVSPGTHTTGPTSGGPDTPPYGVRFRLRADYPLASLPSDGARILAKALQRYGMFLADGGTIPLTVQSDQFTQTKWSDVGVDAKSLEAITPNDFEVVDMGAVKSGDVAPYDSCVRNP